MTPEKVIDQTIATLESLRDIVDKTHEINKRLTIVVVAVSLVWGISLCVIMGFYFIGQGYPDTLQTVESQNGIKVQQNVTKGSVESGK